jgi:hypothetical protein
VRLRATLIEAAGGEPEADTAPSLFHEAPAGVLSELYLGNGVNRYSFVEGGRQLLWESRFAPDEPDYFRVHTLDLGGRPATPPATSPEALHARLEAAFGKVPPLTGRRETPPALSLWSWPAAPAGAPPMTSPSVRLDDPAATASLARRLRAAWLAANGGEAPPSELAAGTQPKLTPEEEAEIRALGYAAGRRGQR